MSWISSGLIFRKVRLVSALEVDNEIIQTLVFKIMLKNYLLYLYKLTTGNILVSHITL